MRGLSYLVVPALLLAASPARAVPPGFTVTTVAGAPANAEVTSMAWAPDGSNRLFITGKNGQVWIIKNGALLAETFITLVPRSGDSGELVTSSECGLLAVA